MPVEKGWVSILNKRFKKQNSSIEITNASISGETTAGGLARLSKLLTQKNYDYLIIELGANDGLRGFPPKTIKNNLLQISQLAKQSNINVALFDIKIPPNYGPRYNQMFNQVFIDVARQENIPLLPFFMEQVALKPELMQADQLHPNEQAQSYISDLVAPHFQQLILAD